MANPARAYLATQVETTTQGELLLMLYEAAIKFLKRAKIEIDNKDFAKKGIYISKAMAIIHELSECLNKEKGGDITPKLGQLYMFCTSQLIKANIRLDNKMIDEVINILDGLRSAYAQIVPIQEGRVTPAGAPGQTQAPVEGSAPPQPVLQAQSAPQAPPPQPAPVLQQPTAYAKPALAKPAPASSPPVQPEIQQVKSQAPESTQAQSAEKQPPAQAAKPAAPQPVAPMKLRTSANAAKFRAANAYTNTTR